MFSITSDPPKIAAIIPTRNRKDKLFRFLERFLQQTYPHLQIIVVDSNSTDGTREAIATQFSQVMLIRVTDQEYWAGATNAGVKVAIKDGYDYILTINDDSIVESNYLEKMVAIAQKHQILILGNCINYLSNPNLIWSLGTSNDWRTSNFLKLNYHNVELSNLPESIRNTEIFGVDALAGNGVLIHRTVFEGIGLYNQTFLPHYHADSEITIRATNRGIKVFTTPSVILLNDFHEDQKKLYLRQSRGLIHGLFYKKSHLFILPIIYIFIIYCPNNQKLSTLLKLINRFTKLRNKDVS